MLDKMIFVTDLAILLWLIGTWFYEGHHKKCRVEVLCQNCGMMAEHKCMSDPKNKMFEF